MNIKVYTDERLFDELKPDWNRLLQNSRANHIFLTWEWQYTWWQSYHPGELHVVTLRDDDGTLVGLASCFIDTVKNRGRLLRFVGCVEVTDYLEIILMRDREAELLAVFADYFTGEGAQHWDMIDFCNIRDFSPTLAHLPDMLRERGEEVQVKFEDVCPVIDLPASWDDYLALLDGKQRREVRRKMRRAAGYGLSWRVVGAEDDLDAEMEAFVALMQASAPEKAEFMEQPGNRAFFMRIAPVLMAQDWLQLMFLMLDQTPIAAYLNFDYGNRIQVYNSGLDPEHMSLSPGWVLLGHAIEHAIELGRDEFDFLQGDEDYKHRMGGEDVKVWMLMTASP